MIFHGGQILTLDTDRPRVEAMAIDHGKIIALGEFQKVRASRGEGTRVVNLKGATLMPSLKDHHLHLLNIGFTLLNHQQHEALFLDLTSARSLDQIARRVAARAAHLREGEWVLGTGWNQEAWHSRDLPTRRVLDDAAPRNPVWHHELDPGSSRRRDPPFLRRFAFRHPARTRQRTDSTARASTN